MTLKLSHNWKYVKNEVSVWSIKGKGQGGTAAQTPFQMCSLRRPIGERLPPHHISHRTEKQNTRLCAVITPLVHVKKKEKWRAGI